MQQVVSTLNRINETLRRGYSDYRTLRTRKEVGIASQEVDAIFTQLRETAFKSQESAINVASVHLKLEDISNRVDRVSTEIVSSPLFHTDEERQAVPLLQEIKRILYEAESTLKQVQDILSEIEKLDQLSDVVQADVESLRNQLVQFSELAGLGLTAEALSHEMKNIADGLAARTTSLITKLRASQRVDPQVLSYTEFVHSAVASLRKQLSHLDPSLRYVREQREVIEMVEFFSGVRDFYQERLERNAISLVVEGARQNFSILLSRGKLTQVVDNLILNSEYWLVEDLRKGVIEDAQIIVRIDEPFIEIHDTGRGVSPSIEHQLFRPFVTAKPKGTGRGLGLFISRQLLDASNCQISLLPTRNHSDRRYVFRIDFSGALHNG
jgi:C4-dicarboxylate-specific signal transduction histidine kinase